MIAPTVELIYKKLSDPQKPSVTLKRHFFITLLSCMLQNAALTLDAIYA